MFNLRIFALLVLTSLGFAASPSAWAITDSIAPDCSLDPVQADGYFRATVSALNIPVDATMPLYSTLATRLDVAPAGFTDGWISCSAAVGAWYYDSPLPKWGLMPSGPYAGKMVYDTGVPGVGLLIENTQNGFLPRASSADPDKSFYVTAVRFNLYFVKIGPISTAGTVTGEVAYRAFRHNQPDEFKFVRVFLGGGIIIQPNLPTCSADTPDIPVTLNDTLVSSFANVGDTSPAKDFNIKLTCGGGDPGTSLSLKLGLTDQLMQGNTTNQLTIRSQTGDATGVKVQLLRNGTPQVFGPTPTTGAEPNVWPVQTITPTTGAVSIPMQARLIRTGTVTPGHVNAIAVYTVLYQ